jgi:hypothetical protein
MKDCKFVPAINVIVFRCRTGVEPTEPAANAFSPFFVARSLGRASIRDRETTRQLRVAHEIPRFFRRTNLKF